MRPPTPPRDADADAHRRGPMAPPPPVISAHPPRALVLSPTRSASAPEPARPVPKVAPRSPTLPGIKESD